MKKITCSLLVAMSLCSSITTAQTFQNFTGTRYNYEHGSCAATTPDGNLIVAGYIFDFKTNNFAPLLVQFNSDGSVNAKLTIPELSNNYFVNPLSMEALHDGSGEANGYVVVFDYKFDVVVVRLNNYSKIVWAKTIHTVEPGRGKVISVSYSPTTNKINGFYLTTVYGSRETLIKLSGDGDILWQKRIFYPHNNYAFSIRSIVTDDDGGCVVAGILDRGTKKPVVLKFSQYGRLLWGKEYNFYNSTDGALITAIAATKGGYILTGNESKLPFYLNLTFKVNKSGDIIWANNYLIPYSVNTPNNIAIDSSGNILFAGPSEYTLLDTSHSSYMVKLDSTGNIVFGKQYSNKTALNAITLAPGGYFAAGNTAFTNEKADLYVIRTNTSGNTGGSCTTSNLNFDKTPTQYKTGKTEYTITDDTLTAANITLTVEKYLSSFPQNRCGTVTAELNKNNEQIPSTNISIAPNPSNGTTTVTYNSITTSNVQLNVYDKTGRVLFTQKDQATKGKNTYQLNLSNLINGIYNLQISNASEQSRVMFVIEK